MTQPQRQWPPYSNVIDAESDLVMIYCGDKAWELAKPGAALEPGKPSVADPLGVLASCKFADSEFERVASIVYPRRADPEAYRWPVKGKQVLILSMGEMRTVTDPLVMELLHQGARFVAVREGDATTFYDPMDRA